VETQDQMAMLRHLRCGRVQGWLFGRAEPAEVARDWLLQLSATTNEAWSAGQALPSEG
jgi:EAL domain-containing protein (putative c-di-GMP-specific phosphodiesterase class I)